MSHSLEVIASSKALILALLIVLLAGCTGISAEDRAETARHIAVGANLREHRIMAEPFVLTVFERVGKLDAPATIYIEGDGLAWLNRQEPSLNPTPVDPLALRLAAEDQDDNVIYMARPCQFSGLSDASAICPKEYWTSRRLSPEELRSENAALDDIKARYHLTGFNLVGYSGGGGVVALLAGMRGDVLSLRTVAGNLDPALFSQLHRISKPAADTLSPLSVAAKTAHIPQQHFVGGRDEIIPLDIARSFRRAVGTSYCIRITKVESADHSEGWVNVWRDLLRASLDCYAPL
ncbi:MAG TPA: hypothetical protein VFT64_12275 [Rickettsiales bacterium]|nr:hypothetical protein [Rickettsiales bacterium]